MYAFAFSLLVNSLYFIADIFIKLGSKDLSAARLVYIRSIFSVALSLLWLLGSGNLTPAPSFQSTMQLIGCSVLCAVGLFTYVKAIQLIHFVNVAVVGITGALIHYALGVAFGEQNSCTMA
jgi:uncharacterized membrane protein